MEFKELSPEGQLMYRIIESWGNAIAMPQMEGWIKEYGDNRLKEAQQGVWVRATDRLPLEGGVDHRVIVRGILNEQGYSNCPFVAYGFRNFSPVKQEMYFELGSKSFLTNDVEWLDESATSNYSALEEKADDLKKLLDEARALLSKEIENGRKLKGRCENMADSFRMIINAPVPANEREYISWFVTAKNLAGGVISEWEAYKEISAWKEGEKEVELSCMVCGTKFMGPEPQTCCSGRDCGCMGLPVDPIVCSKECYEKGIPLQKGDSGVPVELKEGNKLREVAFAEWICSHGYWPIDKGRWNHAVNKTTTTELLWDEWNNQQKEVQP